MSNKTSDKNVENIETVIKDCREHLKLYGEAFITADELDRIEKILAEREQDKKRIQELEEENAMLKKTNNIAKNVNIEDITEVMNKSYEEFMSNYINKQVVIELIENETIDISGFECIAVEDLQELLETK